MSTTTLAQPLPAMSLWRHRMNGLRAWPEADELVWDVLGGRDHLSLMIKGHRFQACTVKGRIKFPKSDTGLFKSTDTSITINSTSMRYVDNTGKVMVLKITESAMAGLVSPVLTIFDVRPAPWTWTWLRWITNHDGDSDPRYHRSRFETGGLKSMDSDRMLAFVEDITKMKLSF